MSMQSTSPEDAGLENMPQPADNRLAHVHLQQETVHADAEVTDDGRLDVNVVGEEKELDRLFHPLLDSFDPTQTAVLKSGQRVIPLNVVIHVVGSRGDVQPFVALAKELQKFGHRVRIATHPTFKRFVEDNDIEFFNIGGDPADLMAFMVKNPGMLPGRQAIMAGEIGKKRKAMAEMFEGCWRSCVEAGNGMDDDEHESPPFIANAIIANPPSFAHIHCAEKLKVPLHLMFTMPWSPTQAFPHPLANIRPSNADPKMVNYLSYALLETMTWQGLGDLINRMRGERLGLSPLTATSAPGTIVRLKIPYSYAWSPALIHKPVDWASHISIPGFYFLSLASKYTPPAELENFLSRAPPPVYIGFGSIVVDDPDAMTALIFAAVQTCGIRALVSQGWGGLRGDQHHDNIFMLGDCPHDWLFEKVSCVVHHGGAGTTAAGIKAGKPTVIIPFFGDQPFWGDMIARAGAGPQPIPFKHLTADKLASAIKKALQPLTATRAAELGSKIKQENGPANGVTSFHDMLPVDQMECAIAVERVAVWRLSKTNIRLSAKVAFLLIEEGLIDTEKLKLYGPCDYKTEHGAFEPVSGVSTAAVGLLGDYLMGFTDLVRGTFSRDNGSQKSGHVTLGSSSTLKTQSDCADEEEGQRRGDAAPETTSRSMQGLMRIASTTVKAPMDMTLSTAQGLHNAPKMYGDRTVREMDKVTGLSSGLKAAGKELAFGVYDGFSGVVTHPLQGRKEGGSAGMYKGIAKGLGGILLKPMAGTAGLFGLTFKGIYEEIQKEHGKTIDSHIRAALLTQGYSEVKDLTAEERAAILERWKTIEIENRKGKKGK